MQLQFLMARRSWRVQFSATGRRGGRKGRRCMETQAGRAGRIARVQQEFDSIEIGRGRDTMSSDWPSAPPDAIRRRRNVGRASTADAADETVNVRSGR